MAEVNNPIYCIMIVKIADLQVMLEESSTPGNANKFNDILDTFSNLAEFDKKRKDKGSFDKPSGMIYYVIDSESFCHYVNVEKSYPEKSAYALLNEQVALLEKNVPDYEDMEPKDFKAKFNKHVQAMFKKYATPIDVPDQPTNMDSVNSKVARAQNKMAENLQTAMQNQESLNQMKNRSANAKLISEEMNYESEGLANTMSWRNKKIQIIAGIVIGRFFWVL